MEEVKVILSKDLFHGLGKEYNFPINIEFMQHTKWGSRNNIINTKTNGVYVIFDAYSGDYHKPSNSEMFTKRKSCLYVGEGNIRRRLNSHDNTERFGKLAEEVVYYGVEDQLERKLLERILIYHYKPLLNKEKGLYDRHNEKINIIADMNAIRNLALSNIGRLRSFLEFQDPNFKGKNEEEILNELLKVSSLNILADELHRKVETIDRLKDIKEFWDRDLPQYRNKSIEEILSKLLTDAPIEYVEDDVKAAWESYLQSNSY